MYTNRFRYKTDKPTSAHLQGQMIPNIERILGSKEEIRKKMSGSNSKGVCEDRAIRVLL